MNCDWKMKPNLCCTILHVCIWAELLLTLNADDGCLIETRVLRNTSYKAVVGEQLEIKCGVAFCKEAPPTVDWIKYEKTDVPVNISSRIKMEWGSINKSEGISFLVFPNIRLNDSGVYQCKSGESNSHYINVFVNGSTHPEPTVNSWTYMYFAAGIVPFIIIVIIISVVSMRGCKGKSKKETSSENQYMAIPIVEQPLHHGCLQPSPRGSPSAPPCRRSLRTKTPPLQPNELPLPRDNYPVYRVITRDRERQRNMAEEEGSSIVYAALNHQPPARAARPPRPTEEQSEYAAIRVKE
ncbi:B- and T-lymphocyte attenuator-like isoform X2 [Pseudochaenichthys georgianus]|uniref:B- and T-lymphocyte attenuator-like isoform X2 n=1 Tax=Pseudochaenichthys georgianus TaxID=52239 RepID=UPI00146B2AA0|nr:uncharacterized protein LOC117459335 isoform X2 [Pseudochaenichthys georgianus]